MHLIVLMKKTKGFQILSLSLFFFYLLLLSVYILNLRQLKVEVLFGIHSIDVLMKKKKKSFPNSPFIFFFFFETKVIIILIHHKSGSISSLQIKHKNNQ
jgi:hypothetical protein